MRSGYRAPAQARPGALPPQDRRAPRQGPVPQVREAPARAPSHPVRTLLREAARRRPRALPPPHRRAGRGGDVPEVREASAGARAQPVRAVPREGRRHRPGQGREASGRRDAAPRPREGAHRRPRAPPAPGRRAPRGGAVPGMRQGAARAGERRVRTLRRGAARHRAWLPCVMGCSPGAAASPGKVGRVASRPGFPLQSPLRSDFRCNPSRLRSLRSLRAPLAKSGQGGRELSSRRRPIVPHVLSAPTR